MALTALLDVELTVPRPDQLAAFWERRGLVPTAPGVLGTADRASQLRLREGPYRHVSELRLACDDEADLARAARRLEALGATVRLGAGELRVADPILDHDVVLTVGAAAPLTPPAPRELNRPGQLARVDRRSSACLGRTPRAPRRVGHVVFGTPDVEASRAFYVDGLGFEVSDGIAGGLGWFLRCSTDHHNLLLMPAPVPCLNHYAVELDDLDAIGLTAMDVLGERAAELADAPVSVAGPGRHVLGANLFWYLLDPAGGMFELFADMDQIVDSAAWARDSFDDGWDPFGIAAWSPADPLPDFFLPADIADLAAAREAAGVR